MHVIRINAEYQNEEVFQMGMNNFHKSSEKMPATTLVAARLIKGIAARPLEWPLGAKGLSSNTTPDDDPKWVSKPVA